MSLAISRRFAAVFLAFAAAGAVIACSENRSQVSEARGAVRVRLPILGTDGVTELGERTLTGIEDLSQVRGRYARFLYGPLVSSDGLHGSAPRARFIRAKDGVYVPGDEQSQNLAAVYSELERLEALDREAGAGDLLSWPRTVGFSLRLLGSAGPVVDNAFYDGNTDSLLVVPYKSGRLPLAMNPGVVGHEHFHALFDRLVVRALIAKNAINRTLAPSAHGEGSLREYFGGIAVKPAIETGDETESRRHCDTILLKSVNEGLADVWGWVHSGDANFVGRSVPRFAKMRDLTARAGELLGEAADRETFCRAVTVVTHRSSKAAEAMGRLNEFSYVPAAHLAKSAIRVLSAGIDVADRAERVKIARRVIRALPAIAEAVTAGEGIGPRDVLKILFETEPLTEAQLEARKNLVSADGPRKEKR